MLEIMDYYDGLDVANAAPCVIMGMPNEVYHSCLGISKTGLDKINKSPAHYKYAEFTGSKAMEIGSAIHCAVLEPELFAEQYLMLPDVSDRRASEYKKAKGSYGDGNVLVGKECAQITGMLSAVCSNKKASELFNDGFAEISVFARDPITGELCKCRFDYLNYDGEKCYAADLKSTADASSDAFSKSIANYRYHVQAAFYSDVLEWATGIKLDKFWFVAVESKKPHCVMNYWIFDTDIDQARKEYRDNLNTYAQCKRDDYWPGYEQGSELNDYAIGLPSWAVDEPEFLNGEDE